MEFRKTTSEKVKSISSFQNRIVTLESPVTSVEEGGKTTPQLNVLEIS